MELLKLEKSHNGKYIKTYDITYLNKRGKEKVYEIVSRNDIDSPEQLGKKVSEVSIVAYSKDKMLLLREFRMGANKYVYNLCSGMLEEGESIEECIERELYEETGLKVKRIVDVLNPCFSAVAISDIKTQIAIVEVEGEIDPHLSDNEDIVAKLYDRKEVEALLEKEEFSARSQLAAYYFSRLPQSGLEQFLKNGLV